MVISEDNISLINVASVLGEKVSVNGVESLDARLSVVCTSDKINKWSKSKPVVLSSDALTAFNNGTLLKNIENWQKASNGMFGLTPGATNDLTLQQIVSDYPEWSYTKPSGWVSEPYILGFFANYNSDAYPPISTNVSMGSTRKFNLQEASIIDFSVLVNRSGTKELIAINDIDSKIKDYYLAILLKKEGTSTYYWYTSSSKISEGDGSNLTMNLNFEPFNGYEGKWTATYCLAANKKAQGDPTPEASFYPIPFSSDAYHTETIELVKTSEFLLSNYRIANNLSEKLYILVDTYTPQRDGSGVYFITGGAIYIRCKIKNLSSTKNITVYSGNFKLNANSYYMTNENAAIYMYNSSKVQINSLTLQPDEESTVYIGIPDLFNLNNGVPTTMTESIQIDSDVRIIYNNVYVGGFYIGIQSF